MNAVKRLKHEAQVKEEDVNVKLEVDPFFQFFAQICHRKPTCPTTTLLQ